MYWNTIADEGACVTHCSNQCVSLRLECLYLVPAPRTGFQMIFKLKCL